MARRRRVAAGVALLALLGGVADPGRAVRAAPAADETTTVELVLGDGADASTPTSGETLAAIDDAGGRVVGPAAGSVLLVDVPVERVDDLAEAAGVQVREPVHLNVPLHAAAAAPAYGTVGGQSAAVIGATDWQAAGFTGSGVRIGVIDYFNATFWNAAEMGPPPWTTGHAMCRDEGVDCAASFTEQTSSSDARKHGGAVFEVLRDVAPGAELFAASVETYADYREAIDWFAANGVTIVSRSLGTLLDGPGDGTGPSNDLADYAAGKGMVWFNAVGNEASGGYWRGSGDDRIGSYVRLNPSAGSSADWLPVSGCTIAALRWSDWGGPGDVASDFDLELYDGIGGNLLQTASSPIVGKPIRQLNPTCRPPGKQLYLKVRARSAIVPSDPDTLEILDYQGGLGAYQAAYSAAVPVADSRNSSVLAVGATDPVGSSRLGTYSSQGPTNDGRTKPDLTAPAGVSSTVYGVFSGTSAAAPAAAGAAALLLQAGLAVPGRPLAALVRSAVVPTGAPVPNQQYGAGRLQLPAPPTTTPTGPTTPTDPTTPTTPSDPTTPTTPTSPTVASSAYTPLAEPQRVLDTRPTSPVGPANLIGRRSPASLLEVPVESLLGRPAGTLSAVALNLTIVDAVEPGWTQVLPTWRATLGAFSNLNIDAARQTRSNIVVVPVGEGGSISVYVGSGGDALIDVLGTYSVATGGAAAAGRLVAVGPVRVLDTRPAARVGTPATGPNGTLRQGQTVCLDTSALGLAPATPAAALVLNVTATEAVDGGYVQALPTGGAVGGTSTLNLVAGGTVANSTVVPLGGPCGGSPHSVSLYLGSGSTAARAHLIVDVTGYVSDATSPPSTAGLFVPITPGRVLDTRPARLASGAAQPVAVPLVPTGATAIAANVTATDTAGWGYLSAWPADAPRPATSVLNWNAAGATIANGAFIGLSPTGSVALESVTPRSATSAAHLLDVFGYFT